MSTLRISHFLFGCRGHVDRFIDTDGVEWIGFRCTICGQLNHPTLSMVQTATPDYIAYLARDGARARS